MKMKQLLASRKFWSMVIAVAGILTAWYNAQIIAPDAINALVATMAAYSIATGIDDNGSYA